MKYLKKFENIDYDYCFPVNANDLSSYINIFRMYDVPFKLIKCNGKKFDKMDHVDVDYFICFDPNSFTDYNIHNALKNKSYIITKDELNKFGNEVVDVDLTLNTIKYNI